MQREVKEHCTTMIMPAFIAMGSPVDISQAVKSELTNYNYIYPVPSVCITSIFYDPF
jgi:hypothetical protein